MSFARYPAYKDSGVEWLGEVPGHWEVKRLKLIASHNDETLDESSDADFEILYVDISSVDPMLGITAKEAMPFSAAPSRARRKVRNGDAIVSTVRTYLRAIARITNPEDNLVVSTGFAVVRPSPQVHHSFLGYLLTAGFFVDEVISRSVGVSYPAINASDLMRITVPVPNYNEQQAIATFLDTETAKIDGLMAEQRALALLLKEKRQAVISHAVTKGLNPAAAMKDSGVAWLGEVPGHWTVRPLKFIATVQTGIAKGKDNSGKETTTVPYLRVANVQDGYLALDDMAMIEIPAADLPRYLLRSGDVLMNEGGDFDKLGRGHIWRAEIEPCIHQNHVFAVRPHGVLAEWLNTVTGSGYAQFYFMTRSKQSTNLASISSSNIIELPVALPPPKEQAEILAFLTNQTAQLDTLTQEAKTAIALLQERRTALISAAVTGKMDVRAAVAA